MSGDRPAGVLQGRRSQPVRHSRLELSHAHERRRAHEIDVRQRNLVRHRRAGSAGRSAEIPRRAALRRPAQRCAREDRAQRRGQARLRQARRFRRGHRRAGFRFHGRLARHGGGRGGHQGAGHRGGKGLPVRDVRGLRRRAHAGRHPVADAVAAHHHRRAAHARGAQALYRGADQSDDRRRHRVLRDARRRPYRRAGSADRLRRSARHRADHPRKAAGGLPEGRISARPRHGRHGGASPRLARDHRAIVPAPDEGARERAPAYPPREREGGLALQAPAAAAT